MKRYAKRALVAWVAFELLGALVIAAGGKTLLQRLTSSLQPQPGYSAQASSR